MSKEDVMTKKKKSMLLIEPSIEEEQQAKHNKQQQQQQQLAISSQISNSKTTGDMYEDHSDQTNVISKSSKKGAQAQRQKSELTSLLMVLFGSILVVGWSSLTIRIAHSHQHQHLSSSATRYLFNYSTPIIKNDSQTFKKIEEVRALPRATLVNENTTLTTGKEGEEIIGINFTTRSTTVEELITTKTTVSAENIAANSNNDDESTTTTAATTIASFEDIELKGEDNDGDTDDGSVKDESKLSGLVSETAGEAADLLVDHLRPRNEEHDNDDEEMRSEREKDIEDGDRRNYTEKRQTDVESSSNNKAGMTRTNKLDQQNQELKLALDTYAKWRSTGDDIIELFSKKMLPIIIEHGYDIDGTTVTGLLQVFNGIRAIKPWALKLLDASAKITPGLLVGTQSDFGDFDECLNVRVDDPSGLATESDIPIEIDESTGLKSTTLVGRYCLADIEFPKPPRIKLSSRNEELQTDFAPIELRKPLFNFSETEAFKDSIFVETGNFFHMLYVDPIRVGICLTNKIDPDSFAKVLNKIVEEFKVSINFHGRCLTKYERPSWTVYQKVSAWVLAVVCSLVVLCTLLDLIHIKMNKLPLPSQLDAWKMNLRNSMLRYRPLFTSFSIIRNTKRLFKPHRTSFGAKKKSSACYLTINGKQFNLNLTQANVHHSTSTSGSLSSESSESSPSIDRRSSSTSSALQLISEPSSSLASSSLAQKKKEKLSSLSQSQFRDSSNNNNISSATICEDRLKENLLCLHGIRVITMTWMIINHTYLFGGFFVLWAHRRLIDIAEWPKSVSFQLVLNGWLTVETYFFLGATIIVLQVMPRMKARKFFYLYYILHRLLRLLPAYIGLVCLNFLWPLISSGPVWLVKGKSFIQTPCENYLWTNFLFINNWIWPEKQCMLHTWFLSADFQLYLLAPIIVYLLYRRPVFGHLVNIIVAIIASIFSGFVIYANKLLPTTLINKLEFDSIKQQLSYSYFATYQHIGPYCLGIFTGYMLHKRPTVHLPKHLTWLLWLLLPPLSFTTLLLTYLWNGAYDEPALINPSPLVSALYVAIHRTIWTSLLAWIVFACSTGRAKLMSSFLSHSMFIPLSRLSYSIYLVHLPVIMFRALNLRHTIDWTDANILWGACGNFIVSLILGYFVNITFESPIINLEQAICGRPSGYEAETNDAFQNKNQKQNAPKKRNLLQPQISIGSKTNSENDSDDNKSAQTNDDRSVRPFDKAGELSGDYQNTIIEQPTTFKHVLQTRHTLWPEHQGSLTRKALGPKQVSSIEKIFGGQRKPHTSIIAIYDSMSSVLNGGKDSIDQNPDAPSNVLDRYQQRVAQQMALGTDNLHRYYSYKRPTLPDDGITNNVYPYTTSNRHQHYVGRDVVYQQPLYKTRPSHYATLARTSRFNHYDGSSLLNKLDHQRPICLGSSKAISHLDESISGAIHEEVQSSMLGRRRQEKQEQQHEQQRAYLGPQRRQGRYNTLTGTGAKEWRQQYVEVDEDNWHQIESSSQPHSSELMESSNSWLQPGTMIPRIDSSTLRRHFKRIEPTSNLIDLPTYEEGEDAVFEKIQNVT